MASKQPGVQETPQQAAMVERAKQQYADYKARWLPVQQRLATQIQEMGASDSDDRTRAKGRAATETSVRFGQAQAGLEKALTASGKGPGSSALKLGIMGLAGDAATSRAGGMATADAAIDNAYVQGLGALTAIGRGEKAQAIAGDTQLAAMSGRQAAADADLALSERMGTAQLVGMGAGMGLNAAMQPTPSKVPQYAVDQANMSTDPIASLNASQGWTGR